MQDQQTRLDFRDLCPKRLWTVQLTCRVHVDCARWFLSWGVEMGSAEREGSLPLKYLVQWAAWQNLGTVGTYHIGVWNEQAAPLLALRPWK